MNKQREALELALEWIEAQPEPRMIGAQQTLHAIREALAEPEQEPVAWTDTDYTTLYVSHDIAVAEGASVALYTEPSPRKPLTDEEIEDCLPMGVFEYTTVCGRAEIRKFARAIEKKIRGES